MKSFGSLGWAVAVMLFGLLIVRDAVRDLVKKLIAAGMTVLERRFSASRWVRARSLRRYRQQVTERLAQVPVPFQLPVDMPLCDVYIPLRAADQPETATPGNQMDLATAVTERRRALVLGPPGSGKSLFLRFLHWSSCSHAAQPRPGNGVGRLAVAVALSDVATSRDVVAEITKSLDRYGFHNAETFVRRELTREHPGLLVLLDGLDEVASQRRVEVAKLVGDFAMDHPAVRLVVTCRTQVYDGGLDGVVDRTFHVQPFTDELVERFLHAWPPMSSQTAVDRLVNALRDTPRVAVMVRNPLLLTLLAYLYTAEYRESTALLPHKRAHFYRDASRLLLQRWRGELNLNKYRWEQKQVVLQHLALVNQGSTADRRGMSYEAVLAEIRTTLPRVDIDPSQAPDVMDEIVERSGMLLRLDGGQRYQFAHITMQEYFAAVELLKQPDGIVDRYRADPSAWREPLKLWCGGEQDATEVIHSINAVGTYDNRVFALECLADATRVEPQCADELLGWAKKAFGKAAPDDPLVHAIGVLASDGRPRGKAMFEFLLAIAESRECSDGDRQRVASALAASNLPAAAYAVAVLAVVDHNLVAHLVAMGNVAVSALELFCARTVGNDLRGRWGLRVIDCLTAIGTPRAAQLLVRLMSRDEDPVVARRAAFALAQLSSMPAVEDALAAAELVSTADADVAMPVDWISQGSAADWVWQPFVTGRAEPERRRLRGVFGRCRSLLEHLTDDDLRAWAAWQREVDQRLLLSLLFFHADGRPRRAGGSLTAIRIAKGAVSLYISDHPADSPGVARRTALLKTESRHDHNPWMRLAALLGAHERLAGAIRPELMWRFLSLGGVPAFDSSSTRTASWTVRLPATRDWSAINATSPESRRRTAGRRRHGLDRQGNPLRGLLAQPEGWEVGQGQGGAPVPWPVR